MGEDDEYAVVTRSKLNLRDDSGIKKKKKKKDKKKSEEKLVHAAAAENDSKPSIEPSERLTDAEKAFKRMQDKMKKERIRQKAEMTHKQRVEKFNQHLDSLTEHFDIPKVSWTK